MAILAIPALFAGAGALIGPSLGLTALTAGQLGWTLGSLIYGATQTKDLGTQEVGRMSNLRAAGANYGAYLPIVEGRMRVQMRVQWGRDIEEHSRSDTQRQGKGGSAEQTTVTYWYTDDFFGLLCESPTGQPIVAVEQILLNGELYYDRSAQSNPDSFLSSLGVTVFTGAADQEPPALIETYEGVGNVPGFRRKAGLAFDNLDLSRFGNRLPIVEAIVVASGSTITLVPQEWITLPGGAAFYDSASSEPYRVAGAVPDSSRVWTVLDVAGNPRRLGLFNAYSQAFDFTRDFDGNVYLQGVNADGSAWIAQEGGTAEGLHHIATSGAVTYYAGSDDFTRYVQMAQAGEELVLRVNQAIGGHQIYTVDVEVSPLTKTNVATGKFLNHFLDRAAGLAGRVYIAGRDTNAVTPSAARVGYVDDAGAWTTLVDYNHVGSTAYGIVGGSYLFLRSGNTGEANRIEKRTHAGVLVDFVTLTTASSTAYVDAYQFSLNHDDGYLFVQSGASIWKINTGTMEEELANAAAGGADEIFIAGSAYQGAGVMVTAIGTDDTKIKIVPPEPLVSAAPPTFDGVAERLMLRSPRLAAADIDVTALAALEVPGLLLDQQTTIGQALGLLASRYFVNFVESDYQIKAVTRGGVALATIPRARLGAYAAGEDPPDPVVTTRIPDSELPRRAHLSYISINNGYQDGQKSSKRISRGQKEPSIRLPLAMTDDDAAAFVESVLWEAWARRETHAFQTTRRLTKYVVGDVLEIDDLGDVQLVERADGANGLMRWMGVPSNVDGYSRTVPGASTGLRQTIVPYAPTDALLLDTHLLRNEDDLPGWIFGARGLSTRWSGAKLYQSRDEGVAYNEVAGGLVDNDVDFGILETALAAPASGRIELFDEGNKFQVRARSGVEFSSFTRAQIQAGRATAYLIKPVDGPGEIIFARTPTLVDVDENIWEFAGLMRCRDGNHAGMTHAAGELFVVLDATTLASINHAATEIGVESLYKAVSLGSLLTRTPPIEFTSQALRLTPRAPVGLGGGRQGDGTIVGTFYPRTRYDAVLRDSVGTPIGEASARYEIDIHDGYQGPVVTTLEVSTLAGEAPEFEFSPTDQQTYFGVTPGAERQHIYVTVHQMSETVGRGFECEGWVPRPPVGAYPFYRFANIVNTDTRKVTVGELQLIDIDGVTVRTAGLQPTTNLAGDVIDALGFQILPTGATDSNLLIAYSIDPNSAVTFATCYVQFELPEPVRIAGFKQAGLPTATFGGAPGGGAGGAVQYGIAGCTLSGSADGETFVLLETFAGITYPGHETLSSLYPI